MKRASEYRTRARISLAGQYGTAAGARAVAGFTMAIASLLMTLVFVFTIIGLKSALSVDRDGGVPFFAVFFSITIAALLILVWVAQCLLEGGLLKIVHKVYCREEVALRDMFYGFRGKTPWRILGISIMTSLMEGALMVPYFVCSVLFRLGSGMSPAALFATIVTYVLAISGVFVISLHFGLALYALMDCPELGAVDCMRASLRLTKKRRWKYLCLQLSFVGWLLLGQLSLGIGLFWIIPYMQCATFHFYEDLKAEKEAMGVAWRPEPARISE